MTDSTQIEVREIPTEEEERPVRVFNGHALANDALHCRPRHLWPRDIDRKELEQHPEWREAIERYLAAFCEPIRTIADEIRCVACDEQVTGHHVGIGHWKFKGKLEYSSEGTMEGRCARCGYPCRMLHEIKLGGLTLVRLTGFPLFYHPSATQRTN